MTKVIIWGHKLHSHTHSYIHHAFYKAFQHLGYNTYWMDNNDNITGFDFSNSIFLTEGQVMENMPIRNDCKYILHNCKMEPFESIRDRCLQIQVFTYDALGHNLENVGNHLYYKDRVLYLYWATDLLPHEINYQPTQREHRIYWVGTMGEGQFGNKTELNRFQEACQLRGIQFTHACGISFEENQALIRRSYMAPAINGTWQVEKGYLPCRIFKNISYGQFGLTNNQAVQDLFNGQLIYSPDCKELFALAEQNMKAPDYEQRLIGLMNIVKAEHTYVNRIETILKYL